MSHGQNVVLLAAWVAARRNPPPAPPDGTSVSTPARTQVIVRRQFFTWDQLESTDYATYIANLRDINCPEQTIRDIIIADVNGLFARLRTEEVQRYEYQWWRATPDATALAAADKKLRDLETERRALLTKLLGPDWEQKETAVAQRRRPVVSLDGPVLGELSEEAKRAIIAIITDSQRRMEELQAKASAEGRKPTSAELAAIRDLSRVEMQKILTPPQLEEFLLRYSQTATDLRNEFLNFSNYWYFDELANKDEEIEHFQMQCRAYRVEELRVQIEEELANMNAALNEYNQQRPHGSLGWQTPAAFAAQLEAQPAGAFPASPPAESPFGAAPLTAIQLAE